MTVRPFLISEFIVFYSPIVRQHTWPASSAGVWNERPRNMYGTYCLVEPLTEVWSKGGDCGRAGVVSHDLKNFP